MAIRPTHDLMVKTGTYQDRDGNQKNRWLKIGSRFVRDDGGEALRIDCIPVGLPEWNGWVSTFPIKPKGENGPGPSPSGPAGGWDDDLPF
jgi:hypothetical protein